MTIQESVRQACACIPDASEVVFLVGAGLSVSAGFPLWKQASNDALGRAEVAGLKPGAAQYAREKLEMGDFYGLFSILQAELTPAIYRAITVQSFDGVHRASETQKRLLRVQARGIITTNFDECLTSAAVQMKGEPPLQSIPEALASDRYFVVKPHGSLYEPGSMVLATADWQRVLNQGDLRSLLEQVTNRNQFVMLGYSASDPDFNAIWNDLLGSRIFRHPALYCCSVGSLTAARMAELRTRDIHVVEFEDPGNFSYVDTLLEGIAGIVKQTSGATIDQPTASTVSELERYVSICLEFSDDRQFRLELVMKAIILEMLSAHTSVASRTELLSFTVNVLGERSSSIEAALDSALGSMRTSGMVEASGEHLTLKASTKDELRSRVEKAEAEEKGTLHRLLSDAGHRHNLAPAELSEVVLRDLVDRALVAQGLAVAEFFLYGRPSTRAGEQLDELIGAIPNAAGFSKGQRAAYLDALRSFVIQPDPQDEAVVFRRVQAYFITTAFVLNPTSERLMAEYASGHIIYLDASVILPALANGHSSQPLYRGLLSDTVRLGMELRVSKEMVNEVHANLRAARKAFVRFGGHGLDIRDVLSGYVALQGRGSGNVFLEGFLAQLDLDSALTPETYLNMVMGGSAMTSEGELAEVLTRRFGITLDAWSASEFKKEELERLTEAIAHLRKIGNRYNYTTLQTRSCSVRTSSCQAGAAP